MKEKRKQEDKTKNYIRREIRIDTKTIKINLKELMRKKMDKKHTERKINLISMEKRKKYGIKINIDNKAAEKAEKRI